MTQVRARSFKVAAIVIGGHVMRRRFRNAELPREVIRLATYEQLELYLTKFAARELGLLMLIGRHGTGKSEAVRRTILAESPHQWHSEAQCDDTLYIEGHVQPFGLYQQLWEHRDAPVVLDDLDKLYADPDCVRLLKPLCNTQRLKRLTWLTNRTIANADVPPFFVTESNVILIANEWRSVNPNVRALEDRAIILHFDPSNAELHRRVGEWFDDREVYDFAGSVMPLVRNISMRHYCKASQLRRAGLSDWRSSLLQMALADARIALVLSLPHEPGLRSERARVERFVAATGLSRATYFRIKARISHHANACQ